MFDTIVQRGTLMTVIVMIICVVGVLAASKIPVQMIPDLDVRAISIRTSWPGATPQDVEKEIIVEQEEYLRNLPNLSRMLSTASSGSAQIELQFPFGTDITDMMIRVNNALSQVQSYPEAVNQPQIFANSFSSNSFMFFRISPLPGNPRNVDMRAMQDFVEDTIKPYFSRVQGVSELNVSGGSEKQLQILVDPAKLAQRHLTLENLRQAIRERNRDRSAGEVESGKRQYLLRTIGRFESTEELDNLILARDGSSIIRLHDVAEIQLGNFEKSTLNYFNGEPNIGVSVRREAGSNVIDIKRDMLAELDIVNRTILEPEGMEMKLFSDDVRYVSASIKNVWSNLILGAILATAVMFAFLRSLKATFVGVMGIPICIIIAFLGLLLGGRTINVLSLAGIAFAIGMTLDNSIVVLESIELQRRNGANRIKAAIEGVRQVSSAVFASTMTTILVFLPVLFVTGEAGQLYSDIAIAISAAILASMLVAITILPTAAARLEFHKYAEKSDHTSRNWLDANLSYLGQLFSAKIMTLVDRLTKNRNRQVSCIGVVVFVAFAIIIWLTPPAEYLPEGEEPKIFAAMNSPAGYNLETMNAIAKELNEYFLPFIGDDPDSFQRGESEFPAIAYVNMRVAANQVRVIVEPLNTSDIDALMAGLTRKFKTYPGMNAFAARGSIISSNDGGSRSVNLDISGPELDAIYRVARSALERAENVFDAPRIRANPASLTLAQPMVEIRPRWERAAELGINAESLGFTVAALTDGSYVDEFFLADDKIDMYLFSQAGQNAKLHTLADLPIYAPFGALLPLVDLAEIRETVDTNSVRRLDGRRTVTLNIIPPRSIPLEVGVEKVRLEVIDAMRANGEIPLGVNLSISGAADQLDATKGALLGNYAVAMIIIYLLLVAIFNHWGYPLIILTTIPLGLAGGLVGLWLLNSIGAALPAFGFNAISQPFDMISMLGFLILMGTVVNNPILIIDRAISNYETLKMNAAQAVREAVESRLRPIAMSTLTTLVGLAPLVLVPGAGTELYRGVGVIVMFGILGAALVSLTMLPAFTILVLELKARWWSLLTRQSVEKN